MKPLTVHAILADPCASSWLKDALSRAVSRDPVDAVNDAEVLLTILKARLAVIFPPECQSVWHTFDQGVLAKCPTCGGR